MTAKATVEIRDVIHVWIEFRAPRKGELAWAVPASAGPEEALEHVIAGRDDLTRLPGGESGFGYHAPCDLPEFDLSGGLIQDEPGTVPDEPSRNIVVHVEHRRTEPPFDTLLSHVRRL